MPVSDESLANPAAVPGIAARLELLEARQRRLLLEVRLVGGLVLALITVGAYVARFGTVWVRSIQAERIIVSSPREDLLLLPHVIQIASTDRPGEPNGYILRASLQSRRDGVVFVIYDERGEPYYAINSFPERLRDYYPGSDRLGVAEARFKELPPPGSDRSAGTASARTDPPASRP